MQLNLTMKTSETLKSMWNSLALLVGALALVGQVETDEDESGAGPCACEPWDGQVYDVKEPHPEAFRRARAAQVAAFEASRLAGVETSVAMTGAAFTFESVYRFETAKHREHTATAPNVAPFPYAPCPAPEPAAAA